MIMTKSAVDDSSLKISRKVLSWQKGENAQQKDSWKRLSCPLSLPIIYSDNKVRKYQKVKWKEARLGGGERVCPTIQNVGRHQKYQNNFLKNHFWQQCGSGLLCLPLTRLMVFRHEAITNLAWKVFVLVSIKELQWLCKYAEEKLIVTSWHG